MKRISIRSIFLILKMIVSKQILDGLYVRDALCGFENKQRTANKR